MSLNEDKYTHTYVLYIHVCTYMYIHIHIIYVYMYMYINVCACILIYTYINTHIFTAHRDGMWATDNNAVSRSSVSGMPVRG